MPDPKTDSERGFLLHTFHRNQGDGTTLFGVGRLESGQTFAFADSRHRPSFYLRASELSRARPFCVGAGAVLDEATELTTMDGEAVVRVGLRKVHQLRRLADGLHEHHLRTYEADFAFAKQYLVDRGIRGGGDRPAVHRDRGTAAVGNFSGIERRARGDIHGGVCIAGSGVVSLAVGVDIQSSTWQRGGRHDCVHDHRGIPGGR